MLGKKMGLKGKKKPVMAEKSSDIMEWVGWRDPKAPPAPSPAMGTPSPGAGCSEPPCPTWPQCSARRSDVWGGAEVGNFQQATVRWTKRFHGACSSPGPTSRMVLPGGCSSNIPAPLCPSLPLSWPRSSGPIPKLSLSPWKTWHWDGFPTASQRSPSTYDARCIHTLVPVSTLQLFGAFQALPILAIPFHTFHPCFMLCRASAGAGAGASSSPPALPSIPLFQGFWKVFTGRMRKKLW